MAMAGVMVQLSGVSAGYGAKDVIDDVSLTVRGGELCAVLGPNGAGKSTLVRLLSGALRPRAGAVILGGEDIAGLPRQAIARKVAVVPQSIEVAMGFTVREVV